MKKLLKKLASLFVSVAIFFKIKKKPIIQSFSQPYIVKVLNDSDEWKDYEVFGASRNYLKVKDGVLDLDGVKIKSQIANVDYADLLVSSMIKPFWVGQTYFMSNEMDKCLSIKKPLIYTLIDAYGNCLQKTIPLVYDPYQQQTSIIATREKYGIDGFAKLSGKIPPKTEIQMYFYPYTILETPISAKMKNY